jgi:membrane associated rhomboid family serine protease
LRIIHGSIITRRDSKGGILFPIRDLNPTRVFPIVTIALIAINVAAYFMWQPHDTAADEESFLYQNAAVACELTTGAPLTPDEIQTGVCRDDGGAPEFPDKNIWLSTAVSMFLHGGIAHLLFNMWFLWIFGNNIEEAYGAIGYLLVYLASGIAATAAFVLVNPQATAPMIGASGAIAGVLGAYLVLFPRHKILSLFLYFFVHVPAGLYLIVWFLLQFATQDEGVAWEAHVGGFVFGALLTLVMRPLLMARLRRIHQPVPRYGAIYR